MMMDRIQHEPEAASEQEESASVPPSDCTHERGHIVDSRTHGHGYATEESRRIFCDTCRLQRWLDVEVALAQSQAELGVIPASAAATIEQSAVLARLDVQRIRLDIRRTGHSFIALCHELARVAGHDAGQFVHFGATTQDIQDTAQSLEMRDALDIVERELRAILRSLRALAVTHRDTLMIGRTHTQPALPTTFGLRAAGWIDEFLRQLERVRTARRRVPVAQLFGGVGTMAAFGPHALELLQRFADRLGLEAPGVSWHVIRDRVAEYATSLALVTGTAARVADEIRLLSHPEFGELSEGWAYGAIGSSTMPHKRNPEVSEQVVLLSRLTRALVGPALEGMVQEHDRDYRGTRLEWVVVADVTHYTLSCLALLRQVLETLQVFPERMSAAARDASGLICSEALMFALAAKIGKPRAFAILYELSQGAGRSELGAAARAHPEICGALATEAIDHALTPASHLGFAGALVDRTVARLDRVLAEEVIEGEG